MTLSNFPDAEPTLTLDFLKSKKLDPRITFRRESDASPPVPSPGTGTHNGTVSLYPGNVPRLTDKGLLIEASRTNVAIWSSDLTQWNTDSTSTIDPNVVTAPDGTLTADKVVPDNGVADRNTSLNVTTTADVYTVSFYIKPEGITEVRLRMQDILTDGKITLTGDGTLDFDAPDIVDSDIILVSGGWYYVWASYNAPALAKRYSFRNPDQAGTADSIGYSVWGFQVELGSFPTSHIPTSGAEVTRAQDICQITGDDFSSWYNQGEGTVVLEGQLTDFDSGVKNQQLVHFGGTPSSNRMRFHIRPGLILQAEGSVSTQAGQQFQFDLNVPAKKMIMAYKANNTNAGSDGVVGTTNTTTPIPTVNGCYIGANNVNEPDSRLLRGYYSKLTYYPTRVPDDALEALTTQQT